ncbi:hypothetical protein SCLCIDRAFT_11592 [Scleroderma citrinum Foug A]|uniref:Uncharacterized protein n=1 Tax=Scleroderma citrinum Foug A TaxID=1036808 RepID=A0A0C2YUV7_9AGAM|nr:hypothetical protein SCLCIDRAFT_11592 [Scleroderma citrinum Foug A]
MTDTNICHADSASANELFKRLTMEERDRFFSALRDPASDIAQSLLASTELDQPLQAPWWELPDVPSNDQKATAVRYGHMPPLLEVPQGVIKWDPASPPLLYNICAILLAYAYATRHFSMSRLASPGNDPQDQREARRLIARAVPFIADRRSRVLHITLSDAVTNIWSRLDLGSTQHSTMAILLKDVFHLLRLRKVVVTEDLPDADAPQPALVLDHPRGCALMALSDLTVLFEGDTAEGCKQRAGNHVTMKIMYYAGHLLAVPSSILDAVADEAFSRSSSFSKK